jgi:hypothetical protein
MPTSFMDDPLPSERVPALNKTARTQFGPETVFDPHSLWPREYFNPEYILAWCLLWPGNTLAQNNFDPEMTMAHYISAQEPKFQKCHFSSVLAFHRLKECLRVKGQSVIQPLKQKVSTLPSLAKNWKICPAKAKNQSKKILILS